MAVLTKYKLTAPITTDVEVINHINDNSDAQLELCIDETSEDLVRYKSCVLNSNAKKVLNCFNQAPFDYNAYVELIIDSDSKEYNGRHMRVRNEVAVVSLIKDLFR